MFRFHAWSVGFVILSASALLFVAASDEKKMEGTVVSAAERTLVMTDLEGNEHSHDVAPAALVMCDEKPCQLADLKEGYPVTVTTNVEGVVTAIHARSKAGLGLLPRLK